MYHRLINSMIRLTNSINQLFNCINRVINGIPQPINGQARALGPLPPRTPSPPGGGAGARAELLISPLMHLIILLMPMVNRIMLSVNRIMPLINQLGEGIMLLIHRLLNACY